MKELSISVSVCCLYACLYVSAKSFKFLMIFCFFVVAQIVVYTEQTYVRLYVVNIAIDFGIDRRNFIDCSDAGNFFALLSAYLFATSALATDNNAQCMTA